MTMKTANAAKVVINDSAISLQRSLQADGR
jgi:hypothetical protein